MICNLLAVSRVSPDFFDFAYTPLKRKPFRLWKTLLNRSPQYLSSCFTVDTSS